MEKDNRTKITVKTTINAPVEKVWSYWTEPDHIITWNYASEDWNTPSAENDVRVGGKFLSRMEANDGSFGFDFYGIYDEVILYEAISYTLGDERKVNITFNAHGNSTEIIEIFDAEDTNSIELQRNGWQAILDHFKKHTEQTVD